MEKMREEFETWFKSFADIDVLFDENGQAFAIDSPLTFGDKIVNTTVDGAWKSWQASRAAQCVELPHKEFDMGSDTFWFTWDIEDALDAAGIRYTQR